MDQRRSPRREAIYHSPVHDNRSGLLIGRIVDVSDRGLSVVATEGLAVGRRLVLSVTLPFPMAGRTRLILRAEVRWSRTDVNPALRRSGLQILAPSPEQVDILRQLQAQVCLQA
jgi:hypothetical protein